MDKMKIRTDGIIFDVDGTIWDSTPVVEKAWNRAFSDEGYSSVRVTADRLKGLFGLPMLDIILDILPESTLPEREIFLKRCSRYEFEFLERESGRVYEGFEEMLKRLRKDPFRLPLFIVSNCQSGYIELLFRKTGFAPYFQAHICPGDTGLLKAENILWIAEKYGLKAPVYVGDTQMDADACRKAGVPIIFAAYGFGSVSEPDGVIDTPLALTERIERYEA